MKETYPFQDLEESIAEIEGVLKLIGEAYQGVVETDHAEGTAAAGIQILRRGALGRLRQNYEAAFAEYQSLRHAREQRKAA